MKLNTLMRKQDEKEDNRIGFIHLVSKRRAILKLLDLASVLHFHMLKNEICVDSVLSSIELDKSQVRSNSE